MTPKENDRIHCSGSTPGAWEVPACYAYCTDTRDVRCCSFERRAVATCAPAMSTAF